MKLESRNPTRVDDKTMHGRWQCEHCGMDEYRVFPETSDFFWGFIKFQWRCKWCKRRSPAYEKIEPGARKRYGI